MRRALGILVFSFAVLAIGPHADARGGGGSFGGGFRGLAGQPPAFRPVTGFHRQFGGRRTLFAARRFHGTHFAARRGSAQVPVSSGWWPWWSGDNGLETYLPVPEPSQPEVIIPDPRPGAEGGTTRTGLFVCGLPCGPERVLL